MEKKKFQLKKPHWFGIITAAVVILVAFILMQVGFIDGKVFSFIAGISFIAAGLPFIATFIFEGKEERDKDLMFLEFTRDLVEGVRSGTPISKSILNVKDKNYGSLSKHIVKLANQISLGIPVKDAFDTFSREVNSVVITRSVTLIKEAERAGGEIETILSSVVSSVSQIEKLRKERKAAIYNLAVQGYIIFLIFIVIMLVMQFKIVPLISELPSDLGGGDTAGIGGVLGGGSLGSSEGASITAEDLSKAFLLLILFQGFFAGLVIGKISEGKIKSGFKHSFILVAISWIIVSGANIFIKVGGA